MPRRKSLAPWLPNARLHKQVMAKLAANGGMLASDAKW